jgi:ABC-type lipoprotein release transport system permease subunit
MSPQHLDPMIAASCTVAMFLMAAAASAIPALRACQIGPVRALRHD